MSRRRISWSELPAELLTPIYDRLGAQIDICTFRLVCKAWCDSTSFSTRIKPLNILSPFLPCEFTINEINFKEKLQTSISLTLVPCSVFIVQSLVDNKLPTWLCDIKEVIPGKIHARKTNPYLRSLNLAFFRVSEMGRFYTFKIKEKESSRDDVVHRQRLDGSKVVLISNPKFGTLAGIVDYKAIVLGNDGNLQMISIKHGIADRVTGPYTNMYDDVVNFQGSIYAIDRVGRLYFMGYNDTKLKMVMSKPVGECSESDTKKRIVVDMSTDELYLVHRYTNSCFKLYKMNFKSKIWDEVLGIGVDRILVVIRKRCFFTNIPGLPGNSIIFRKGDFRNHTFDMYIDIDSIFSFQDGSCKTVGSDILHHRFWPPPRWVLNDANLFNSLSITRTLIVREVCNHIFSESSCTTGTCVAEPVLHMRDELKGKTGIRKIRRLCHDHVQRMATERKRQKLEETPKQNDERSNSLQMTSMEEKKAEENVLSLSLLKKTMLVWWTRRSKTSRKDKRVLLKKSEV